MRQGNFVGAGVNTVTRSGGNTFHGSIYRQFRDDSMVGTQAGNNVVNVGTFEFANTGGWVSGPIWKNKAFFFFNVEDESLTEPGTTFRANTGGETAAGGTTRVLASDLDNLSNFLSSNFGYQTGGYQGYDHEVPARRYLVKGDYNLNTQQQDHVPLHPPRLDHRRAASATPRRSASATAARSTTGAELPELELPEQGRTSARASASGTRRSATRWPTPSSSATRSRTRDRAARGTGELFPLVDILDAGTIYTSFGYEPFTPNNELRYNTFQVQNNFTKFANKHTLTFGATAERYDSTNVFFPGSQSVYVYNSLADFYTDANDYLANPNRTMSPVSLRRFQVRWSNIPGQDEPLQPLEVLYAGAYAQDEWAVRDNLKITAGIRLDVPELRRHRLRQRRADALTFRDENGSPVQYSTAKLPDPKLLWSPACRLQLGRRREPQHAGARRHGHLHGPAGLRVDLEPDRQHGRAHGLRAAGRQHDRAAVQPEPGRVQADQRHRRAGVELRARADRSRLQVPAAVAHQHRASTSACSGAWSAPRSTSTTVTSTACTTSTPTCRPRRRAFTGADARPRYTNNRIHSNVSPTPSS